MSFRNKTARERILEALQNQPYSFGVRVGVKTSTLADRVGYPQPTVRREIQALRNMGYTVENTYDGYRLA